MTKRFLTRTLFPLGVRNIIRTEARSRGRWRRKDGFVTLPDGSKFGFVPGARLHDLAPGEHVSISFDPARRLYVVGNSAGSTTPVAGIGVEAEVEVTAAMAE